MSNGTLSTPVGRLVADIALNQRKYRDVTARYFQALQAEISQEAHNLGLCLGTGGQFDWLPPSQQASCPYCGHAWPFDHGRLIDLRKRSAALLGSRRKLSKHLDYLLFERGSAFVGES